MEISRIGAYGASSVASSLPFKVGMPGRPQPQHIPEGIEVRRRVFKDFGIEILDSDVKFSKAELLVVEEILRDIKKRTKKHLIGVKEIVKNKAMRINLLKGAQVHAGGAYVAEQKRIYLFDDLPPEQIPEVLVHEVGHAVNYFNLSFERFMRFVQESGWNMTEMRRVFFNENRFYQFGARKMEVPRDKWEKVWNRFSLNSIAKEQDAFGEMYLTLDGKTKLPWDKNPLEKFAWAYEWYYGKNEAFKKIALEAQASGDETLEKTYEFMEKEVFSETDDEFRSE
ncbi:MAG: hypothetical protein AABZ57_06180 [Candidatus Margulisiibacteriota bacterium]